MRARTGWLFLLLLGGCPGADGAKDGGGSPAPDAAALPDTMVVVDIAPDTHSAPVSTPPLVSGNPKACGPAPVAYSGTLCGPSAAPCKIKVDGFVPAKGTKYTSMVPDQKGGLHLLAYANGSAGYYMHRPAGGSWTGKMVSFDPTWSGMARLPSGDLLAINTGDILKRNLLLRLGSAGWKQHQGIPSPWSPSSRSWAGMDLRTDSAGCLHFVSMAGGSVTYMQRGKAGTWKRARVPAPYYIDNCQLALSPGGVPYVAYHPLNEIRLWALGDSQGVVVNPANTGTWSRDPIALAVTGPSKAEVPHVLSVDINHTSGNKTRRLVLSSRTGGSWTRKVVGTDESPRCPKCTIGAKCTVDYLKYGYYTPTAMVASGTGDLRLFYFRTRVHGVWTGSLHYKTGSCTWSGQPTETGQLRMAWLSQGKIRSAVIKDGFGYPDYMEAILDSSGDIHLMFGYQIYHIVLGK